MGTTAKWTIQNGELVAQSLLAAGKVLLSGVANVINIF